MIGNLVELVVELKKSRALKPLILLVRVAGLEPTAS